MFDRTLGRLGHALVHRHRVVAFDEQRRPSATAEELVQLLVLDAREQRRVADLEAVEVQDGQHGAIGDWVQQLVRVPCGRERSGLGLAIADHAGDDQVGVVEGGAEGMAERVAEFAAFVDRARRGRCNVARDATGKRELLEELLHAGEVLRHIGIDPAPGAFEVHVAHECRTTMPGAGDIQHVQIKFVDDPVQVHVDEVLAGHRAPVAHHQRLDVRHRQRLAQHRVVVQVQLPDRQVVRGTPVGVDLVEKFVAEGVGGHGSEIPFSSARILSRRRWWRGAPEKRAFRNTWTRSKASPTPITAPPRQARFMSSSSTPWCAVKTS